MALETGSVLAHYEITDQIGKGGMGEVYRARDTKLGREVAIKVLPAEFSKDEERLLRLEREARMLAALNHPNIAAIHGLEESDDTRFLVLELVGGSTLADRLRDGAIPVAESLKLALQVAEALEAAHERGVIHRDLKPANVKITPEGRVKVLDFGLAKAMIGDQADVSLSNSPTLSVQATARGIVLGTAAYMSPEQASGEVADHRSDVWAFGVVLFEMLSGRQLFTGKTAAHVMGAVLNIEPEWSALPGDLHPRLRVLLERLLEKEPKDRLSGISDARVEIQKVLGDSGGVQPPTLPGAARQAPQSSRIRVAVIVVVGALTGIAGWWLGSRSDAISEAVTRFDYDLPDGTNFRNIGRNVVSVSPDGRYIVFNGTEGLYLRPFAELESSLIPGTEGDITNPVFSPDSRWIAFWNRGGRIEKIAINGGTPVPVAPAAINPFDMSWGDDDTILFTQPDGIYRVSANGGAPQLVVSGEDGVSFDAPQLLPDGKGILYTAGAPGNWNQAEIVVGTVDPLGEQKVVWHGGDARYVPTGHLTYVLDDDLFAIAFDLEALEVRGSPVALEEGLARASQAVSANYGFSADGSLVYRRGAGGALGDRVFVWVDRMGDEDPIEGVPPRPYFAPRLSPGDGTRIAVEVRDPNTDIWVHDLARGTQTLLTFDAAADRFPVWTPDGERIAFSSDREGQAGRYAVYWTDADGTEEAELFVTDPERRLDSWSWTPDGEILLINEGGADIGLARANGERMREAVLENPGYGEGTPEISPDGRWMAYRSNESGQYEIYVRPFPDVAAGKWQVSTDGGQYPGWSPDGSELFYRSLDGSRLMGVTVVGRELDFTASIPRPVVEGAYVYSQGDGRNWDVSPDGQRFLFLKAANESFGSTAGPQIVVVENWFQELRGLVPVD